MSEAKDPSVSPGLQILGLENITWQRDCQTAVTNDLFNSEHHRNAGIVSTEPSSPEGIDSRSYKFYTVSQI